MISRAITFCRIGIIAVVLGFGGVGGLAMNIGWILLAVGAVVFLIHAITGRRRV